MVEKVENVDKPKNTIGFGVTGVPVWLFKELTDEANRFYNGSYWPVLVGWCRKARESDHIRRGGLPSYEEFEEEKEFKVEEKPKKESVSLMGGNVGVGRK